LDQERHLVGLERHPARRKALGHRRRVAGLFGGPGGRGRDPDAHARASAGTGGGDTGAGGVARANTASTWRSAALRSKHAASAPGASRAVTAGSASSRARNDPSPSSAASAWRWTIP